MFVCTILYCKKNRAREKPSKNFPILNCFNISTSGFGDNWVSKVWAANIYIYGTFSAQEVIDEDNKSHEKWHQIHLLVSKNYPIVWYRFKIKENIIKYDINVNKCHLKLEFDHHIQV